MLLHLSMCGISSYRPKPLQSHCKILFLSILRYLSMITANKSKIFCAARFRSFLWRGTVENKVYTFLLCAMNW
uniref:Uncharacterized protein n=1 Tax=Arundo donax TaxID=35708 RepID=A0A0A9EZE2_ARUDO